MFRLIKRRKASKVVEDEKMAALEKAEKDLGALEFRAFHAIRALDERGGRNHWREAVERMIQGA